MLNTIGICQRFRPTGPRFDDSAAFTTTEQNLEFSPTLSLTRFGPNYSDVSSSTHAEGTVRQLAKTSDSAQRA